MDRNGILRLLENSPIDQIRAAAGALSTESLISLLDSKETNIRRFAAAGLCNRKLDTVRPLLAPLIDRDAKVRRCAAMAVTRNHSSSLCFNLDSEDEARSSIDFAKTMQDFGQNVDNTQLLEQLGSQDLIARRLAACWLQSEKQVDINYHVILLDDEDPQIQRIAALAIIERHANHREAIEYCVRATESRDKKIALWGLERLNEVASRYIRIFQSGDSVFENKDESNQITSSQMNPNILFDAATERMIAKALYRASCVLDEHVSLRAATILAEKKNLLERVYASILCEVSDTKAHRILLRGIKETGVASLDDQPIILTAMDRNANNDTTVYLAYLLYSMHYNSMLFNNFKPPESSLPKILEASRSENLETGEIAFFGLLLFQESPIALNRVAEMIVSDRTRAFAAESLQVPGIIFWNKNTLVRDAMKPLLFHNSGMVRETALRVFIAALDGDISLEREYLAWHLKDREIGVRIQAAVAFAAANIKKSEVKRILFEGLESGGLIPLQAIKGLEALALNDRVSITEPEIMHLIGIIQKLPVSAQRTLLMDVISKLSLPDAAIPKLINYLDSNLNHRYLDVAIAKCLGAAGTRAKLALNRLRQLHAVAVGRDRKVLYLAILRIERDCLRLEDEITSYTGDSLIELSDLLALRDEFGIHKSDFGRLSLFLGHHHPDVQIKTLSWMREAGVSDIYEDEIYQLLNSDKTIDSDLIGDTVDLAMTFQLSKRWMSVLCKRAEAAPQAIEYLATARIGTAITDCSVEELEQITDTLSHLSSSWIDFPDRIKFAESLNRSLKSRIRFLRSKRI